MEENNLEDINRQFDEWNETLSLRSKNLKLIVSFEEDEELTSLLEELKEKEIIFD